jgi:Tol biopolymer transport system component
VQDGLISPDGKYLAYVDLKGIHIKTIDTDDVRTLHQPPVLRNRNLEWAVGAWFPDSTRLILNAHPTAGAEYLTEFEADEDLSIWEFPFDGGAAHLLRNRAWGDAISPDGAWISFRANRSRSGSREVWLMDSAGNSAHKLFDDAVSGMFWSPRGRRVWYLRGNGTELQDADFRLISFPWQKDRIAASSAGTDITPPFGMDNTNDVAALPDGRFLYSVRDAGTIGSESCNFWTVQGDPETDKPIGKPRQLTHWTGFCMSDVSVTKDGKYLAFQQWSGHPALYVADLDAGGTRIVNERHFTGSESAELWADWTRDSKSLIFLSNRSGRLGIYRQVLDADTSESLVSPQNGLAACCVSPDGKWLIYRVHDGLPTQLSSAAEEVMRVPLTGGASEKMFPVKRLMWWGCARAAANLCAIAESTEDRKQAIVTAFDPLRGRGAELTRITIEPNVDWALALSPEGERFAVIRGSENRLQILSLKGDVLAEIAIPEWRAAGPIEWANGNGLFVPTLTPGGASLLYVNLQGKAHVIRENRGGNYAPGLPSPDGRHIAMVGTAMNSNMWLMKNF